MKTMWEKWLRYNLDMYMRHIGTAGMAWAGTAVVEGHINWKNLGVSLLAGAIIPTTFTILQQGLPNETTDSKDTNSSSSPGNIK